MQTFGDPDYRYQTASLGKSFTMACLQLAVDEGLIESADDLIKDSWTGEGQLNGPHKYLDHAHHRRLSFLQLSKHIGGFPVTNGQYLAGLPELFERRPALVQLHRRPGP